MNDISNSTRRDTFDFLSIGSTIMANERTLLAFLRTSITFFVAGIGMVKYLDHPVLDAIGWFFVVLAGIFFIWGVHRYRYARKELKKVTSKVQQSAGKEMGLCTRK